MGRFAGYLEGVLISHTVAVYFELARRRGLSFEDSLLVVARHTPFSRTTLTRRLKDWQQKQSLLRLTDTDDYVDFVTCSNGWGDNLREFLSEIDNS